MATELNLNTLNWVTLACPDCASEVQILDDATQRDSAIRCPGCGVAMAVGDPPVQEAFATDQVSRAVDEFPTEDGSRETEASSVHAAASAEPRNESECDAASSSGFSAAEANDESLDVGLTDNASKDEAGIPGGEEISDGGESAVLEEIRIAVRGSLEACDEDDCDTADARLATNRQRLLCWLRTRRRQLTGTVVSLAVHLLVLGVLALIVFQIGQIDSSSDIDGRIGSAIPDSELRNLEDTPPEEVTIEPVPNPLDVSRIARQQADPRVRPGEGEVREISLEGPSGLLETLTAEPRWQTPTGQGLEGRTALNRSQLAMLHGGTEKSESTVEEGLKWLIRHQRPNGSWSFRHRLSTCTTRCRNTGSYDCPTGATGLALLCFLGAGYTHKEGPYQKEVGKALAWLVEQSCLGELQYDLSRHSPEANTGFYAQGMASIALCEAYGMTKDPGLKQPAQDALDFISQAQDPMHGGWRYQINERGDTSVVGWQVMALVSGRMAGLQVPRSTRSRVLDFLTHVRSQTGDFGYTDRYRGTVATTGIGVLCTMYLDPLTARRTLRSKVQELSRRLPMRNNLYANYYLSQVLHHFGGPEWTSWNSRMRKFLVGSQLAGGHGQGSWHSGRDYEARGGRLYSTCLSILILEVYYRHLPLYQQDATLLQIPEVQTSD